MPDASATRLARLGLGAKIFIAATLSVAGVLGVTLGLTSLQANRTADESIRRALAGVRRGVRSEEHTSELQSPCNLVCRLLLEKKKKTVVRTANDDTPSTDVIANRDSNRCWMQTSTDLAPRTLTWILAALRASLAPRVSAQRVA